MMDINTEISWPYLDSNCTAGLEFYGDFKLQSDMRVKRHTIIMRKLDTNIHIEVSCVVGARLKDYKIGMCVGIMERPVNLESLGGVTCYFRELRRCVKIYGIVHVCFTILV